VLINNHTAVWGSWWHDGQWGYACCRQGVKNSYCTGATGGQAADDAAAALAANLDAKLAERAGQAAARAEAEASGIRLEGHKPKASLPANSLRSGRARPPM
jgi:pre-mRNA-processing factor SLU7